MSIPFFSDVLAALGKRLNYESVSNLFGNSFCKDAAKIVQEANPLIPKPKIGSGFAQMLSGIKIVKAPTKEAKMASVESQLGDISWAEGIM